MDWELPRLKEAIQDSRQTYQVFGDNRNDAIRQYVGARYSENGATQEVPMNLLSLYCSTVVRALVPRNPRGMFSTFDRKIAPTLEVAESHVNKQVERIYLDETLRRASMDALFLMGIVRVALVSPADAAMHGYSRIAGQSSADVVDYDDFVIDQHCKDLRYPSFIGHRFEAILDTIKDSKLYSKVRKDLKPDDTTSFNEDGGEKASTISKGPSHRQHEFEDYTELWQIYLPRTKELVTFHMDHEEPLRVEEWIGPECGPYHLLWYGDVPGSNPMPKSPIMDLVAMHMMYNELVRKIGLQALGQKTILGVGAGSDADADRIGKTQDGFVARMDNPDKVKELNLGGPNQLNMNFIPWLRNSFDWHAGNLSMMGGLGAQSPTATQDQMLERNASKFVNDLQHRTINFTRSVFKALAWFVWHHPTEVMKAPMRLPSGRELNARVRRPIDRLGINFEEADIDIDPYSMVDDTPQSKLMLANQVMSQILIPMAGQLQQQGIAPNIPKYLKMVAKYANFPEMTELVEIAAPLGPEQNPGAASPANTTRTYERVSKPGQMSDKGMADAMMRQGAGITPQKSEMEGMEKRNGQY